MIAKLIDIVGDGDVLTGAAAVSRDPVWETHQPCHARALLRPSTTDQVSQIMLACHAAGQPVVPYGGITNLVQACSTVPSARTASRPSTDSRVMP